MAGQRTSAIGLNGPIGVQDNRNAIINGDYNIFQRGLSSDVSATGGAGGRVFNQFVADRWRLYVQALAGSTSPDIRVSQEQFTPGEPSNSSVASDNYINIRVGPTGDVSGNSTHGYGNFGGFCGAIGTTVDGGAAAVNSFVALIQDIEDINTFHSKSVTLTFQAKSDITDVTVVPVLKQCFAGGTTDHTIVGLTASGFPGATLTSDWKRFETNFKVPSLKGQPAVGTSGDSALQLQIVLHAHSGRVGQGITFGLGGPSGKTGNIGFAQVQLEQGDKPTTFEKVEHSLELQQCERFFEKSYDHEFAPGHAASDVKGSSSKGLVTFLQDVHATRTISDNVMFKTLKRVSPGFSAASMDAIGLPVNIPAQIKGVNVFNPVGGNSGGIRSIHGSASEGGAVVTPTVTDLLVVRPENVSQNGFGSLRIGTVAGAENPDNFFYVGAIHYVADAELSVTTQ